MVEVGDGMSADGGLGIGDTVRNLLGIPKKGPGVDGGGGTGVDSAPNDPALTSLASEARKGGRRGGKTRQSAEEAIAAAQLSAAIEELYAEENWEEVGAAYFELRYATTGFEPFRLSEKQRRVMARSLAMTMKTLAITDPKWIALTIFGVNFSTIIAQKEMAFAAFMKEQKAKGNA